MGKNDFDEVLGKELKRINSTLSVEDALTMILGKDQYIVPENLKKYTAKTNRTKRKKRDTIDGNKILDEIRSDRNNTPSNSGTISSDGKVLVSAKGSKPIEEDAVAEVKLTPQESFLDQIQNYNDFIIQNDLDVEQINPSHDFDFTAFASNEDWKAESQRLKDRLNDRMEEIKQNEDAGEFSDMELEDKMPTFEAIKNMSDEEFKVYKAKYLTPKTDEFKNIPAKVQKADLFNPQIESARLGISLEDLPLREQDQVIDHNLDGSQTDPTDINGVEVPRKQIEEPSTLAKVANAVYNPSVVLAGAEAVVDAGDSIGKMYDQGVENGIMPTLRDAGRGITAGLYDSADFISSVGGLTPNAVSKGAGEIADNIRADMEIPDSEVERVTELASEGVVGGGVGGAVGKGLGAATGVIKKLNILKGAEYDRHIRKVAKDAGEIARESKSRGKYPPKYNADMVEANAYNNLQKRDASKLFSTTPDYGDSSLLSKAIENMKYPFTGRGSLERNNLGLESLFNQGHSLDDAQKILHSRFAQYPTRYGKQGQDIGSVAGVLMGLEVAQ